MCAFLDNSTESAQQKQDQIKEAFKDWIFSDRERRDALVTLYNTRFNATRPRAYDGSHILFHGMNPEKTLRKHQRDAVARILYGNRNVLLAHCVGAGKTYVIIAGAMESKKLGLCHKSMIAVPNHLTEQVGSDFLALYLGAEILVAKKEDFEPENRKKFCSRIATSDYDAVIIGHSQFGKIPLSPERQHMAFNHQIDDLTYSIDAIKAENGGGILDQADGKAKKV